MRYRQFVFVLSVSAFAFIAAGLFSFSIRAATTLETVVGECRKRTGFGEATCRTLVKKYMNVDRCKEYTGYSDEECAKRIEEIKNDAEFSTGNKNTDTASLDVPTASISPVIPPATQTRPPDSLAGIRAKKEQDLILLWQRTEALTEALRSKGMDTRSVEEAFPEFEQRAETLLAAYDAYRFVYESTSQDAPTLRWSARSDARDRVIQTQQTLVDYYRTSILIPLRAAHARSL